jgi:hypothetical protein
VTTAKLADNSVTTAKLRYQAVTTDKLAASAVTEWELADDAVTFHKIANDAVKTIRSIGLVAANSQTDQALTALGFPHTTRTPAGMAEASEYINGALRLCWISGTTLEVAPIAFFGNLQTQAVTLYAKGNGSTALGILGFDTSWTITANT